MCPRTRLGLLVVFGMSLASAHAFARDEAPSPTPHPLPEPEATCSSDADCAEDEWCALPPSCDFECPEGEFCEPCGPTEGEGYCVTFDDPVDSDCESDADCGEGLACRAMGEVSTCEDSGACTTETFFACVDPTIDGIGPCASDADCGEDFVCHVEEMASCDAGPPCIPGEECGGAPEPSCETQTVSYCAPRWAGNCEADADCGEGFACKPAESCGCSGGGFDPGTPIPPDEGDHDGDGHGSDPRPDGGSEGECSCEPAGYNACELIETECTADADCAEGWTCEAWGGDSTCAIDPDGEETCESAPARSICLPPYWYGPGTGGGGGIPEEVFTPGAPRDTDTQDDDASTTGGGGTGSPSEPAPENKGDTDPRPRDLDDGGCSATTNAAPALPLLLATLLGLVRRRRR